MAKKKKTPYEVLGVSPNASKEEIDKAFRKKARKVHPDAGGDEKDFKELNECHALLVSDQRREKFDESGDEEEDQIPPVSLAMQILSATLNLIIESVAKEELDVERVDLVLLIKKHLGERLKEIKQDIKDFEKVKSTLIKAKKRFKRKKKSDNEDENTMMEASLDFHIQQRTRVISNASRSMDGTIDALKMIDQFIYEREKEPKQQTYHSDFFSALGITPALFNPSRMFRPPYNPDTEE